jgi:hypothetical protein
MHSVTRSRTLETESQAFQISSSDRKVFLTVSCFLTTLLIASATADYLLTFLVSAMVSTSHFLSNPAARFFMRHLQAY